MARALVHLLDRLLQILLPTVANRIGYYSQPDASDSAYYLYRHLVTTRSGMTHVWLLEDPGIADRLREEFARLTRASGTSGNRLRVVKRAGLTGYFLHLTCRYLCYTQRMYAASAKYFGQRIAVCLWHGMPIKSIGLLDHNNPSPTTVFGHVHIASSHFFKHVVASAFGTRPDSVLVCQSPRCDVLHFSEARAFAPGELRDRLKLGRSGKLVLWLPTFRGAATAKASGRSFRDDLPPWVAPKLEHFCDGGKHTVLLKLHKYDAMNQATDTAFMRGVRVMRAEDWARQGVQLYELLAECDALISDVSSVVIDYIPTGKPIGILGFDPTTYGRELTFPFDYIRASRRFHVIDHEAAMDAFLRQIAGPEAITCPPGDVARFLHYDFQQKGSEAIAAHLGL